MTVPLSLRPNLFPITVHQPRAITYQQNETEQNVDHKKENVFSSSILNSPSLTNKRKIERNIYPVSAKNVNNKLQKITKILTPKDKCRVKIINACKKHCVELFTFEAFMQDECLEITTNIPDVKFSTIRKALERKESGILKVLIELGADLNQFKSDGLTLLTLAVLKNQPDSLKLLAKIGADLNYPDKDGDTPLTRAIIENQIDIIKLLVDLGADLNRADGEGKSPLVRAVNEQRIEIIKLLAELGAELNLAESNCETPLTMAILENKPNIINLLIELGANSEYAEEILTRRFLANVWGLDGTSDIEWTCVLQDRSTKIYKIGIELEGFYPRLLMKRFAHYIPAFFKTIDLKNKLSKKQKLEIEEAFKNAFPLSKKNLIKNVSRIKSGKPFVILGGSDDHAVSMVIHKNLLAVYNRGLGGSKDAAAIYNFPSSIVNEKTLKLLLKSYRDMESFNQMIVDLELEYAGGFTQKAQSVGNCAWASAKGAFKALIVLLIDDETTATEIYKQFTAFVREKSLHSYFKNSTKYAEDIFEKIQDKLSNKPGLEASKELLKEYFSSNNENIDILN
ncbi:MAG: ankyrin repeat domain-containing protein [Parachlamydiaceae bacterium]|nr:ankyrin repeat domain-containing protein [Parachlamydiaceae bacterium]